MSATIRPMRWLRTVLAAAAFAATTAHAMVPSATAVDDTVRPGERARVGFTIDFGAGVDVLAFDLALTWNATKLAFAGGEVTAGSDVVALGDIEAPQGARGKIEGAPPAAGTITALWYGIDPGTFETHPLPLEGNGTLWLDFDTGAGAGRSGVRLELSFADTSANPIEPAIDATAWVTVVPEPASVALMLAGLAAVGAAAARRHRKGA